MNKKNTKKIITFATTAAAVAGGVAVTTNTAHADAQPNLQPGSSQEDQQASALKAQQDTSRHVYADAKTANDNAQGKLAQAEQAKTDAQTAVNTTSDNVQSATVNERNTQTQVDNAQADVNTAQDQYDHAMQQAAQEVTNAHAIADAQQSVKNTNQAVTDTQSNLAQKQSTQAQAQNNADNAAQNVKDAKTGVTNAQTAVNNAQAAVNTSQDDLTNAQNHAATITADQKDVTAKQSAKNTADSKVSNAQTDRDNKNAAVTADQTAVDNAQKAVNELNNNHEVVNNLTISDTYLKQINKDRGQTGFIAQNLKPAGMSDSDYQELVNESHKLYQENTYQNDPAADAIAVHMNPNGTLSAADVKFATQYAVQLLNPLRRQAGSPLYTITNGSLQIAQDVANRYSSDNWNQWEKGHDNNGLKAISSDWGAPVGESWAGDMSFGKQTFVSENTSDPLSVKGTWVSSYSNLTRNDLQRGIYNAIKSLLFEDVDEDFGHATDVLGIREANPDQPVELGVDYEYDTSDHVSTFAGQKNQHAGGFHFNSESSSSINPSGKLAQSQWQQNVAIPTTSDHATQLANAKQNLQDAQSKLASDKATANQANTDLASAKTAAESAAQALADAKAKLSRDETETMSVADAQKALDAAQATLAQKKTNLADANTAEERAQSMKSQADTALTNAKNAVTAAQTAVANAKAAAQTAQAQLDALTNADAAVKDAKAKLDIAKEKLQVAQSNHDTARDALTQAQRELNAKEAALQDAQTALQAAQTQADATAAALAAAKTNLISDARLYGDSIKIKQQAIHAGDSLAAPVIENSTKADPTQDLALGAFLRMASAPLDDIPTGTTAAWADPSKVAHDDHTEGTYTEKVHITFPDGSTSTAHMILKVLAATTPAQPAPNHDSHAGAHQSPAGNSMAPVRHAVMVEQNDGRIISTEVANQITGTNQFMSIEPTADNRHVVFNSEKLQTMPKRSTLNNGQLPQTGNHNHTKSALAMGIASVMTAVGLMGANKKRRHE